MGGVGHYQVVTELKNGLLLMLRQITLLRHLLQVYQK